MFSTPLPTSPPSPPTTAHPDPAMQLAGTMLSSWGAPGRTPLSQAPRPFPGVGFHCAPQYLVLPPLQPFHAVIIARLSASPITVPSSQGPRLNHGCIPRAQDGLSPTRPRSAAGSQDVPRPRPAQTFGGGTSMRTSKGRGARGLPPPARSPRRGRALAARSLLPYTAALARWG